MSERKFVKVDYAVMSDTEYLSGPDKLVYVILCKYANWTTGRAFPSIGALVKESGYSRNTVRRSLDNLAQHGLITKEERRASSHLYILCEIPEKFGGGSKCY